MTPVLWNGHLINGDNLAEATWSVLDTGKYRVSLQFTGGVTSNFTFTDKTSALNAIKLLHRLLRTTRRG